MPLVSRRRFLLIELENARLRHAGDPDAAIAMLESRVAALEAALEPLAQAAMALQLEAPGPEGLETNVKLSLPPYGYTCAWLKVADFDRIIDALTGQEEPLF